MGNMLIDVFLQFFRKPATNKFPVKYTPKDVTGTMKLVQEGKVSIVPPVSVPENFRGKIAYDRDKCIGCGLCANVCPSKAIELYTPEGEKKKKIRIYVASCTFCSQCNDICPVNALSMSEEFLLADTDKFSKNLIVD